MTLLQSLTFSCVLFIWKKLGFESLQRLSREQKINAVVKIELQSFAAIACVSAISSVSSIHFCYQPQQ